MGRKKSSDDPRAEDRHKVGPISYRPLPEVREVLQQLADEELRSLTNMINVLVLEGLQSRGKWLPKTSKDEPPKSGKTEDKPKKKAE